MLLAILGLPHSSHKNRGYISEKWPLKKRIQIVTILLNKCPSQSFSANDSLNFIDIKFRGRHCLITLFT